MTGPKNTLALERKAKETKLDEQLKFVEQISAQLFQTHEAVMDGYTKMAGSVNEAINSLANISVLTLAMATLIGEDKVNAKVAEIKAAAQAEREETLKKSKLEALEKGWLTKAEVASEASLVVVEVSSKSGEPVIEKRQEVAVVSLEESTKAKFLGVKVGDSIELEKVNMKVVELYDIPQAESETEGS